jgi:hypothetical protein
MPMSSYRAAFIAAMTSAIANPTNEGAAIGTMFDQIVAAVQASTITVNTSAVVAPPGGGPVTGTATASIA